MKILLILLAVICLLGCESKFEPKKPSEAETANSGKLTVFIDNEIKNILDTANSMYAKQYPNVLLSIQSTNARTCFSNLLSGKARVIVTSRDYLGDEDSLMKVYKVSKHQKVKIADDALVFFTNKESNVDTLNSVELQKHFTEKSKIIGNKFIASNINSASYANFLKLVAKNKKIVTSVEHVTSLDEVKQKVLQDKNTIGISYLSHVLRNDKLKLIRIGFYDTTNTYIAPLTVHQANIVQKKYPYIISYYSYLLEDRQNLPYWYSLYLGRETKVQKYFLDSGIVPGYAVIKLNFSE